MKKALIFATKNEAAPFISGLDMEKADDNYFPLYKNDSLYLIISGVGKTAASVATAYIILTYDVDVLYNFGSAGSLKANYKVSEVFQIERVWESDRPLFSANKPRFIKPDIQDGYKTLILACQDHPVINDQERTELGRYADLADMESAGFISSCKKFNRKGYIFKIISDTISDTSKEKIINQINKMSIALYNYVVDKNILTKA